MVAAVSQLTLERGAPWHGNIPDLGADGLGRGASRYGGVLFHWYGMVIWSVAFC